MMASVDRYLQMTDALSRLLLSSLSPSLHSRDR
jgi:hypothetical protein